MNKSIEKINDIKDGIVNRKGLLLGCDLTEKNLQSMIHIITKEINNTNNLELIRGYNGSIADFNKYIVITRKIKNAYTNKSISTHDLKKFLDNMSNLARVFGETYSIKCNENKLF